MFFAAIEPTTNPDPWRFQLHLEVWILIAGLIAAFVYTVRVLGPKVAPAGQIMPKRQKRLFILMIGLLWFSSDWPMHDIAEEYLYSVHMVQHMILTYMVPPLALLATPEWLFRLLIGKDKVYNVVRIMTKPVVGVVVSLVNRLAPMVGCSSPNALYAHCQATWPSGWVSFLGVFRWSLCTA